MSSSAHQQNKFDGSPCQQQISLEIEHPFLLIHCHCFEKCPYNMLLLQDSEHLLNKITFFYLKNHKTDKL